MAGPNGVGGADNPRPVNNVERRQGLLGKGRSAVERIAHRLGMELHTAIGNALGINRQAAPQPVQGPDGAAAPVAPADPPEFNPKKWLTDQCTEITTALNTRNPEGNVDENLTLNELYKSAQHLKNSLDARTGDIRASLPPDLRADFDANVAVIDDYFNTENFEGIITQHELRFFQSYVNFLKTCIAGTDAELNKSLAEISKSLDNKADGLTANITQTTDQWTGLNAEATRLEGLADEATRARNAAQHRFNRLTPAERQTEAELTRLNTAAQADLDAQDAATAARAAANNAGNELLDSNSPYLPEETKAELTCRRTAEALSNIIAEIAFLEAQLEELYQNGAPEDQMNDLADQIGRKVTDRQLAEDAYDLAELDREIISETVTELKAESKDLISKTQTLQMKALQGGGEVDRFATRVMDHTLRQLKDVVCIASATKNPDPKWVKFAQALVETSPELPANNNVATRPPEGFPREIHPNGVTTKKVGDYSIYEHAIRMFDNNNQDNDDEAFTYTVNDKKLALNILGAFSALQSVRDATHPSYDKAFAVLDSSGKLLGASLALQTLENDPATVKTSLSNLASELGLEELSQTLNSHPEVDVTQDEDVVEAQVDDLKGVFKQGVDLAAAKTLTSSGTSVSSLLEKARTDRTYENDVTVKNGASRQTVFKESMLQAIEILKTRPDSEADLKESRMWRASEATLNRADNNLNDLLGLTVNTRLNANTEFLDKLVVASTAHNDLANKEKSGLRGSLLNHIDKYGKHSTRETLKNHSLDKFGALSNVLIETAIYIRPTIQRQVDELIGSLTPQAGAAGAAGAAAPGDTPHLSEQEIQHLIKLIIVTTDAKAAGNSKFNLKQLIDSGNQLAKTNSPANRDAFGKALAGVKDAWESSSNDENPITKSNWLAKDKRSGLERAVKSNPVKSLPFINQIPVLGRTVAAVSNIAKFLIAGSAGAAVGAVASGAGVAAIVGVIGGAVIAAPFVGAYTALQRTM